MLRTSLVQTEIDRNNKDGKHSYRYRSRNRCGWRDNLLFDPLFELIHFAEFDVLHLLLLVVVREDSHDRRLSVADRQPEPALRPL